ncbi:SGNH/GDSL hydrolase family protein [Nocardioides sp. GXZ039]|uniref:SGNH/GDSL hydrolase family protein n=1 Tax=Nocardioides sp. GXZ039 TaxID=3136018 RepID=UPI0030F40453
MESESTPLRYVAIGDSLSEGVGDAPWPDGTPRGWTDRLADLLAVQHAERGLVYANLAVRGYKAAQVRDTQVAAALEMAPDVVTLTAGMNDLLRPRIDFAELRATLIDLVAPFTGAGARLVVVPIPNLTGISPAGGLLDSRRRRLNAIYEHLAQDHGMEPVTDTTGTIFEDPRAWDEDRLHLTSLGHERLAYAAAASLGAPPDFEWLAPPPGLPPRRTLRTEAAWCRQYVAPWLGRRLRGQSSGDHRIAKRPDLTPWQPTPAGG